MSSDLNRNYSEAVADADSRGLKHRVGQLENLLTGSVATINISPNILLNMTLGTNYRSYHKALDQNLREIAERQYHAHRTAVDAKVHPGYGPEILNAAVSPDGRGLTNYGEITLRLRDVSIGDRTSVLRENAYAFYERYDLGKRDAEEEAGWRAVWADRARLGVAHIAPSLPPNVSEDDLSFSILHMGLNRDGDQFIEAHIYGEFTCQALDSVSLDRSLTRPEMREEWALACQKLERHGITVEETINP